MKRKILFWPIMLVIGAFVFVKIAVVHPDIEEFSDTAFA